MRMIAAIGALACCSGVASAVGYAEGVNGDLSGNRLAPTNVGVLALGSNTVTGSTISGDIDYWRITVPAGGQLTQLNLTSFVSADDLAFIAIQAGTTFTETAASPNVTNLLGYTHFGPGGSAVVGSNILDDIGTGPGAIGFSPPLGAGDYTFWVQQTSPQSVGYGFELVVVPAPGIAGVMGMAGVAAMARRRRDR